MILVGVFSDKMGDVYVWVWQKIFKKYKALRVPNSQSLKE